MLNLSKLFHNLSKLFHDLSKLLLNLSKIFHNLLHDLSKLLLNLSKLLLNLSKLFHNLSKLLFNLSKLFHELLKLFHDLSKLFQDLLKLFYNVLKLVHNPLKTLMIFVIHFSCDRDETIRHYTHRLGRVQRFSIQAFRFLSNHHFVYLHCDLVVCHAYDYNSTCARSTSCSNRHRRDADERADDSSSMYPLSFGPVMQGKESADSNTEGK